MSRKTKKLEPFSIDGKPKYTESDFDSGRRSRKRCRQDARDANRSLKKSKRQELKVDLRTILDKEDE